jgi:prepilin-type N-terminal cleavage/methylation domain-containing protein
MRNSRRGVSLMEVVIVLAVIGVFVSMSAPSFRRSMEQTRADIAGSNLRAIWSAQRIYWLEHRSYASNLSALESSGLLDPAIVAGTPQYAYSVVSATNGSFTAAATRRGSTRWSGQFLIDEDGAISGALQATGEPNIVPGFQ